MAYPKAGKVVVSVTLRASRVQQIAMVLIRKVAASGGFGASVV
jgi:hypothetical protein